VVSRGVLPGSGLDDLLASRRKQQSLAGRRHILKVEHEIPEEIAIAGEDGRSKGFAPELTVSRLHPLTENRVRIPHKHKGRMFGLVKEHSIREHRGHSDEKKSVQKKEKGNRGTL
jgi:hypothetical protein